MPVPATSAAARSHRSHGCLTRARWTPTDSLRFMTSSGWDDIPGIARRQNGRFRSERSDDADVLLDGDRFLESLRSPNGAAPVGREVEILDGQVEKDRRHGVLVGARRVVVDADDLVLVVLEERDAFPTGEGFDLGETDAVAHLAGAGLDERLVRGQIAQLDGLREGMEVDRRVMHDGVVREIEKPGHEGVVLLAPGLEDPVAREAPPAEIGHHGGGRGPYVPARPRARPPGLPALPRRGAFRHG